MNDRRRIDVQHTVSDEGRPKATTGDGGAFPESRVHGVLYGWLLLFLGERANHGYDLVRQLSQELPADMVPDPGVVYRMLRKLELAGSVHSTLQSGAGGPARKVYSLTPEGREALSEWRTVAQTRIDVLQRFLDRYSRLDSE